MENTNLTTKTFINQAFYTSQLALQIQLTSNGIFVEIAPAIAKLKYDWSKKAGVKLSLAEVSNLLYAFQAYRSAGESAYIKVSQDICGGKEPQKYRNMQFCHQAVRTGFNVYGGNISFIIKNPSAKIDFNFPILPAEKMKFEKVLEKIISLALENQEDILTRKQKEKVKAKVNEVAEKTNIVKLSDHKKQSALESLKDRLTNSNSSLEQIRSKFLAYCIKNELDFTFIEIESLFSAADQRLSKSV